MNKNTDLTITLSGKTLHYSIRYSKRAKFVSLSVGARSGVVAIIPHRLMGVDIPIESLLQAKARWIFRKLDHISKRNTDYSGPSFTHGERLPFVGRELFLVVHRVDQKEAQVQLVASDMVLSLPHETNDRHIKELVVGWYKWMAKSLIPERVEELNRPLQLQFHSISVRDQSSRWGSCSRKGTLSFNWRLILLPSKVMDYLIIHELAHLQEMNHSKRFWDLVGKLCPAYMESEMWLKMNGARLFW
jgi:predicted metal-dependent hydrolase